MRKNDKKLHIAKVNKLTEERQNQDRTNIDELFGLSRLEKFNKNKNPEIEKASNEINSFNFEELFYQPMSVDTFENKVNTIQNKIKNSAGKLPTVAKYIPQLFELDNNAIGAIKLDKKGNTLNGIIPISWFRILDDGNGQMTTNQEAGDKLKSLLVKKMDLLGQSIDYNPAFYKK